MSICVKFFARLREQLNLDEVQVDAVPNQTALSVWQTTTGQTEMPPQTLVAINQEYANADSAVHDSDEVAFFPPVTGG